VSINPPVAMVKSPRGGEVRPGRGFSIGEVKAVNLTVEEARLLGIPVEPGVRLPGSGTLRRFRST